MFKEEGYRLMGAAFEVYNQMSYGMAEEVYQQSRKSTSNCVAYRSKRKQSCSSFIRTGSSRRDTSRTFSYSGRLSSN
jgi:hypothetical protein